MKNREKLSTLCIPDKIRKRLIKDTFADEILEHTKEKDLAVKKYR